MKSTEYEHFSIDFHQKKYNHVSYHWTNISEKILFESGFIHDFNHLRLRRKSVFENTGTYYNPVREFGLDGISIEYINNDDKIYHGIQSKYWKSRSLTASDLGSFYQAIFMRMKTKDHRSKGYLYHSCKLQTDVRDDILFNKQIINHYLDFNTDKQIISDLENTKNEAEFELRDYQKEAIFELKKEWCGIKLLNLPCGMGKTVIFNNYLKESNYKNIFIFSPLKIHVQQNLDRMINFLPNYKTLLLDSDGTTDINLLKTILKNRSIISSTYESAENVVKDLFEIIPNLESDCLEEDYLSTIDLSNSILIIDEAHNLINREKLNNIIKNFPKVLLVSATPPSCLQELFDSDIIYKYPFYKAIENKYICDYQIYIPFISINDESNMSEIIIEKPIELKDINSIFIYKILYLINGMLQTGSRKCIAYLTSHEHCIEFTEIFKKVMSEYHYIPLWIETIISDISCEKRRDILSDFQKDLNDGLKILCSVRILNEAIDIPKCDSIFIENVGDKTNDITIVQRICRANRLVVDNPNKVANCFLWTTDLNKILETLSLLKENDINFYKKIFIMNGNYNKNGNNEYNKQINNKNINLQEFIHLKCHAKKYDPIEIAKNIFERALLRQKNGGKLLPQHHCKNKTTDDDIQETKDAKIMFRWKKKSHNNILNKELKVLLDSYFKNWDLSVDEKCFKEIYEIVERAKIRISKNKRAMPRKILNIKSREENPELLQEHKDRLRLYFIKNKLNDEKCPEYIIKIKEYLDQHLPQWNDTVDLKKKAYDECINIVNRAYKRKEQNLDLLPKNIRRKNKTNDDIQETKDALVLRAYVMSLQGKGNGAKCYDIVKDYLDQNLPGWRDKKINYVNDLLISIKGIVIRANKRLEENKHFLPKYISNKSDLDLIQENKDAEKLNKIRKNSKILNSPNYIEIKKYLDENLPGWI